MFCVSVSTVLSTHLIFFQPHKSAHRLPRLVEYNEQMSTFFIYRYKETLWSRKTLTSTAFRFVASVGIVPQWFSKRRSFANSIAASGSGIGGLAYSLASQAMIQSIGLGWAFRVLAILAFAVNALCAIVIRDRNRAIGSVQLAFDVSLFRRKEFILLQLWGFFSMLGYIVLLFSLPNYARSIGLSAKQGSVIGALLNLGQGKAVLCSFGNMGYTDCGPGAGRPLVGYFSDTFGRINMAGTGSFFAGLCCLVIWTFAKDFGVLIFFALIVRQIPGPTTSSIFERLFTALSASEHSDTRKC